MTTEPTDAELDALRQADNGELNFVTLRQFRIIARAALAKWGSPAQAAEPVAVVVPCYTPSGKRVALCSAKQDLPIGTKLYAAPQPSPTAQAAESVLEDAARYRWLRRWKGQEHEPPFTVQHELDGTLWGGDLDAAIDAAMDKGGA